MPFALRLARYPCILQTSLLLVLSASQKDLPRSIHFVEEQPRGAMALASLRYSRRDNENVETDRTGVFIYDGTPSRFHEWEFRSKL